MGVEPRTTLSRKSISAFTRTCSETLKVGSTRSRMFPPVCVPSGGLVESSVLPPQTYQPMESAGSPPFRLLKRSQRKRK